MGSANVTSCCPVYTFRPNTIMTPIYPIPPLKVWNQLNWLKTNHFNCPVALRHCPFLYFTWSLWAMVGGLGDEMVGRFVFTLLKAVCLVHCIRLYEVWFIHLLIIKTVILFRSRNLLQDIQLKFKLGHMLTVCTRARCQTGTMTVTYLYCKFLACVMFWHMCFQPGKLILRNIFFDFLILTCTGPVGKVNLWDLQTVMQFTFT